jgi:hypothetical protein
MNQPSKMSIHTKSGQERRHVRTVSARLLNDLGKLARA